MSLAFSETQKTGFLTLRPIYSLDNVISTKISCAGSEGSGESAHLHRLAGTFVTVPKYHVLAQIAICVPFILAAKAVANLHQQPCNNQYIVSMCQKMLPVRCHKIPQ